MSIKDKQEEIISEFEVIGDDREMANIYLMELGSKLAPLADEFKTDQHIVKGCQSKVWMHAFLDGDVVRFEADSNTAITKGLASLLVRVFSGETPEHIIAAELFFPGKIGMDRFIGTQRSNGFGAMIKQMKLYAVALKSQKESI